MLLHRQLNVAVWLNADLLTCGQLVGPEELSNALELKDSFLV